MTQQPDVFMYRRGHDLHRFGKHLLWSIALILAAGLLPLNHLAAQQPARPAKNIVLEVFIRGDSERSKNGAEFALELAKKTRGLEVQIHDVLKDGQQLSRLWKLAKSAGRDKPVVPAFRSCERMYFGFDSAAQTGPNVKDLYTAHVYTRATCPRCRNAKAFLWNLQNRWPALQLKIYEITEDVAARQRWQDISRRHNRVPGLPTILFAGRVMVGYQGDHITGKQFEDLLIKVSDSPPKAAKPKSGDVSRQSSADKAFWPLSLVSMLHVGHVGTLTFPQVESDEVPPPPGDYDDVPLPDEALPEEAGETGESEWVPILDEPTDSSVSDTIDVPFLGELRVSELGLPLFTFLVGLIDGFNPCAMWVLVFLLSVLVNIKDRRKILLIAGTFVLISGLAYFTFMAAWLNLFMLIGMARGIQLALGVMAIFIGLINVKDFFAFKKGITLSIPESAKPRLYARVRDIVSAKYLTAALMGAVVLAILVNMVELLCTAGLPALYTQILTMHGLPAWKNYMYLGLYISAYMLDDAILLAVVVTTLSHRKLQEREGRWLKLISGVVILVLGVVMIFKPEWMQLGQ